MSRGHRLFPGPETIDIHSPHRSQLYLLAVLPCDRQNVTETYFENQFIYQLTLVKCSGARRESITTRWCWPCGMWAMRQAPRKCNYVRGRCRARTLIVYSSSWTRAGQWNNGQLTLCKPSRCRKNGYTVDIRNSKLGICWRCRQRPTVISLHQNRNQDLETFKNIHKGSREAWINEFPSSQQLLNTQE